MTMIIAHRGGKALGPENIVPTMKKALALKVHGLEFDVRNCYTEEPVIIHDADLERTTDLKGNVAQLSLEEIQRADAGDGSPPPSLLQALDALNPTNALIFLDIKHPKAALPTALICNHYIREKGYSYGQLVICSFFHQLLVLIHEKYPKLVTGASVRHSPDGLAACGEYTNSRYVLPDINIMDESFVSDARKRGLKLITWVCDTPEDKRKALDLGVDGIITSDPRLYL